MLTAVKTFFHLTKESFRLLKRTEPMILSSSTAFFTTFALSPIVILLLGIFGLYFKSDAIKNQLFGKLASTIGPEAALGIESIVNNFMSVEANSWMTAGGIVFFIFIATTVLLIVKHNIHKLWRIRKTPKHMRFVFRERVVLAGIILLAGVLFLISILVDSSLAISLDYLQIIVPHVGIIVIRILNLMFSLIVVTIWFTILFKVVPQARVDWDVAFNGGLLTAILFSIGQYALGIFLLNARIITIFGASASFAVLLLFIFYTSFIIYFGAAFTHQYAEHNNKHICAGKHAHEYEEKLLGVD